MQKIIPLLLFLAITTASIGFAQETNPTPTAGDVPTGPAQISVHVKHANSGQAVPGVEVILYSLDRSGKPGVRRGISDEQGRFVFRTIAIDLAYLVGARYKEVPFSGGSIFFDNTESEKTIDLFVREITDQRQRLAVNRHEVGLEWQGQQLLVREEVRLTLQGEEVLYLNKKAEQGRTKPAFRSALLPGATDFRMPLGVIPEGVEQREDEVLFYGPFHPGENALSFQYNLVLPEKIEFYKTLLSPTGEFQLRFPQGDLSVKAASLETQEMVTEEGRNLHQLSAQNLKANTRIPILLTRPTLSYQPEALQILNARWVLEMDAAALRVSEEYRINNSASGFLGAPEDEVLLRISIPNAAQDLRFPAKQFELGIASHEGGLVLRGPIPPGETSIQLAYQLPVEHSSLLFERQLPGALPLLSVFIADTGIQVDNQRLHRRRPVHSEGRNYIQLEAFQIEAQEKVSLELTPLRAKRKNWVQNRWLWSSLALFACLLFLLPALFDRQTRLPQSNSDEIPPLQQERRATVEALRDLEHDFETGKLEKQDYQNMRDELRQRAMTLREKELSQQQSTPPPSIINCPACKSTTQQQDRFCAQCGQPLEETSITTRNLA